jgi:glycosyltransferase involved in cell wall biosynthesis
MKILIICDSFNIGGIQRLALDQAYGLADLGVHGEILVMSSRDATKSDSFEINESGLIRKHRVKINYLPGTRKEQFLHIKKMLASGQYNKIFAHSLRGGVLAWVICKIFRYDLSVLTVIHQLPSLSSPIQRYKRMFYSQFCDKLYIFSVAAKNDWLSNQNRNLFVKLFTSRRKVFVCRNGVYLPRLTQSYEGTNNFFELKRIMFIGRLTAWKGLATFLEIAQLEVLKKQKILIISPTEPHEFLKNLNDDFGNRITCITGKSVSEITFYPGDLLLYPVIFEGMFIEGVSINVLEMACIGVPSIISNGVETWPELVTLGILQVVNWKETNSIANLILNQYKFSSSDKIFEARRLIDINNNLNIMLQD